MITATLETIKQEHVREVVTREIWQSGIHYFKHDAVLAINRKGNTLSASVQGNGRYPYEVHIIGKSSTISQMACTCPYSSRWGWVCKHIVAVLLVWIQQRDRSYDRHHARSIAEYQDTIINSTNPFYSIFTSWFSSFDRIKMHVDLVGNGPQLEITFYSASNDRQAKLTVPAGESPELFKKIRSLPDVEWSDRASMVKVNKSPLVHELMADYDEQGRLMLVPGYSIKSAGNGAGFIRAEEAKLHIIDKRWFWDNNTYTLIEELPDALVPYFDGSKPLLYTGIDIVDFFRYSMPALENEKMFKPSETVKNTRILPAPRLKQIKVEGEGDWLYLAPYYEAMGEDMSLDDIIRQRDGNGFIKHENNWFYIPDDTVKRWKGMGDVTDDNRIRISRLAYTRLRSEMDDTVMVEEPEPLHNFYMRLNHIIKPGSAPPTDNMNGTLRDYQKAGYEWLWFLHMNNLNGVLADEMGLGKTHQAMALLCAVYPVTPSPSIIVAPTSVLDHWEYKLHEYLPWLVINKYHDKDRSLQKNKPYHVLLTTYAVLSLDIDALSGQEWEYVILDEAQKIKNYMTKAYRAAKSLIAKHRLALTGTPVENKLTEMWSIFDFLLPGYLGSLDRFVKEYETPITKYNDDRKKELLKKIVSPFTLRRLKSGVLKELPQKLEDVRYCSLTSRQVSIYKNLVHTRGSELIRKLGDETMPIEYLHVFALITKLKRLCDHPALAMGSHERSYNSGKFELFKELVEEAMDSGEKVVVFSQYLEMLDLIEQWLKTKRIAFSSLRGSTRNRSDVIKKFQHNPRNRVFVSSLLAGGLGIDLTSASVVIHYDRWWNAAREEQATDRVHRIGQKKGVQVFKLITRGTLEEKIDDLIKHKASLMDGIIESDDALIKRLSREELMDLLKAPNI